MEIEDNVKQCLLSRGFTKKQLLNNRGLIGATIDETVKLLTKPAVIKSVCVSVISCPYKKDGLCTTNEQCDSKEQTVL